MKRFLLLLLVFGWFQSQAQKPKLVVGIVVDQMRSDYLDRFQNLYGEDGFERLRNEGAEFRYAHFNYTPTYTGPGHASVYTGTPPFHNGIIGNNWYDPYLGKQVYCVQDEEQTTIGAANASGQCSPHRMRSGSLGDAMELHTYDGSKVYGISIKDRGAILPAGHSADGAYWYDSETGQFVSSSYYMNSLPEWLLGFNKRDRAVQLMKDNWTLLTNAEEYKSLSPDEGPGERDPFLEGDFSFPHDFSNLDDNQKRSAIRYSPCGNTLLTELALELLKKEELGKDEVPDLLAISYSSPDYIGHLYGPNSWEIADNYARLDREIAQLLKALDKQVGKGNYTVFLTADHGVKPNGAVLMELNIPAGSMPTDDVAKELKKYCQEEFGDSTVINTLFDNHIYLNRDKITGIEKEYSIVLNELRFHILETFPNILQVYTKEDLRGFSGVRSMEHLVMNGMNPLRTGDLVFELYPNYITGEHEVGTTHGSSFDYDTHVPLLFFGNGVPKKKSVEEVYVIDIAPTISNILGMMEPDGCIGRPLF